MEKKYSIVKEDSIEFNGHTLYRIRAERDIPEHWVSKGDIGGYIEREDNLSQDGDCFVNSDAMVYGKSRLTNEAYACGNAVVKNIVADEAFFGDEVIAFADDVSKLKGSVILGECVKLELKLPKCTLGFGSIIEGDVVVVFGENSCEIRTSQVAKDEFKFNFEE